MEWRPSATIDTLRQRAELIARIREFFAARGVLEVETPSLAPAGTTDPALSNVTTELQALGGRRMYLQTSPEFAMKRLLAAGSGDIYQLCRVYRDDELGRWHQPEFTLLEWYRVGWDDSALMAEVLELLERLLPARPAVLRLSYRDALRRFAGIDIDAGSAELCAALQAHALTPPSGVDPRGLLDFALGACVVPALPKSTVTFIVDYPADQAALARIRPTTPPTAARFEVFYNGAELANGFAELTDALEQRRRFEAESAERRAHGREAPPLDEALLAALEHGLPECAGVAVGVDRLVAAAAGRTDIASVMSFAHAGAPARSE
jgi:lysyl-tRNA synthetase class 2